MSETPTAALPPQPPKRKRSRLKRLIACAAILVVVLLILPVINLLVPPPSGTVLTRVAAAQPEWLEAATILERNCLDCHSPSGGAPLYARLPVAGTLIERDREDGIRSLDLFEAFGVADGKPLPEAALAKLEYAIESDSMPPARYLLMHWNRGVDSGQKSTILNWVRGIRKQSYATEGVVAEFLSSPLQPLPGQVPTDARKVALGNKLYHDVRLSGDNTLSCASCHALDKGGTDQTRTSKGISGAIGPINAPTVYNSVFNVKQFWDGRAEDLHEQAGGPVENPIEMGARFAQVIEKLQQDEAFANEFKAVYADGLTKENITHAIAEFEKTLVTPNCRFDQFLKGKADALTAEEKQGHALFLENGCATCHVGKAMGGQSFERMGRRADYFANRGNPTDADNGRFSVTQLERDRHVFKVPTLRNVAVTHPYFHDGSQQTLEAAVAAMAKYQATRAYTDDEVKHVVSFLKTLTGEYQGRILQ